MLPFLSEQHDDDEEEEQEKDPAKSQLLAVQITEVTFHYTPCSSCWGGGTSTNV